MAGRAAGQRLAAPGYRAGVIDQARYGVEQGGLAGAVQPDDRDELPLPHAQRHALERLRLAVEHADIVHRQQRAAAGSGDRGARGGLDRAAEIDAADGLVAHDLLGGAFGHALAEIHRQHAIDQGGDPLHIVIDQQHGVALGAEARDEGREIGHLAGGEAGEGFVHQDHARVAGDGLGQFEAAQIGEGQGRWQPVDHGVEAHAGGDLAGAVIDVAVGEQPDQAVRQQRELDVLQHGLAVQRAGVLEHQAHALARDAVRGPARDLGAGETDGARVRALDAHDELHHGGFAGTVRPDQPQDFSGRDRERHVLDCDQATEPLGQAGDFEQRAHARRRNRPRKPPGTNRMTASATPETTNVESWPSGRRISPATMRKTAPMAAPRMVRRPR